MARIDWAKDARAVSGLIRGLDPRPGAWTELKGKELKLFCPKVMETPFPGTGAPGEIVLADTTLVIATGPFKDLAGGSVEISEVQPAGKERMAAGEWLRGARIKVGSKLT